MMTYAAFTRYFTRPLFYEVGQLLDEVDPLFYEVGQLLDDRPEPIVLE